MIELICIKEREDDFRKLKRLALIKKVWAGIKNQPYNFQDVFNACWLIKRYPKDDPDRDNKKVSV